MAEAEAEPGVGLVLCVHVGDPHAISANRHISSASDAMAAVVAGQPPAQHRPKRQLREVHAPGIVRPGGGEQAA